MAPGPVISANVKVDLAGTRTKGETFQPCPRSRAAPLAAPSVDMPALPFSPVKFSGPIERVLALERRLRLPRVKSNPLNGASAANTAEHSHTEADQSSKRDVFFIHWLSECFLPSGRSAPTPAMQARRPPLRHVFCDEAPANYYFDSSRPIASAKKLKMHKNENAVPISISALGFLRGLRTNHAVVPRLSRKDCILRGRGRGRRGHRRSKITPRSAASIRAVLDAVVLPRNGIPGQTHRSRAGKARPGDADLLWRIPGDNQVVEVKPIRTVLGGIVLHHDCAAAGWKSAGQGERIIVGPTPSAAKALVGREHGSIDGNDSGGVSRSSRVPEHQAVGACHGAIDVELNPLVVGVPPGDISPAGETAIEGFELDMVEHRVFGFVLMERNAGAWIAPVNLGKTAECRARGVVLGLIHAGLWRPGPVHGKRGRTRILRQCPNGIRASLQDGIIPGYTAPRGVQQAQIPVSRSFEFMAVAAACRVGSIRKDQSVCRGRVFTRHHKPRDVVRVG